MYTCVCECAHTSVCFCVCGWMQKIGVCNLCERQHVTLFKLVKNMITKFDHDSVKKEIVEVFVPKKIRYYLSIRVGVVVELITISIISSNELHAIVKFYEGRGT